MKQEMAVPSGCTISGMKNLCWMCFLMKFANINPRMKVINYFAFFFQCLTSECELLDSGQYICDGRAEALKTNPISFKVKSIKSVYSIDGIKRLLVEKQAPLLWSHGVFERFSFSWFEMNKTFSKGHTQFLVKVQFLLLPTQLCVPSACSHANTGLWLTDYCFFFKIIFVLQLLC